MSIRSFFHTSGNRLKLALAVVMGQFLLVFFRHYADVYLGAGPMLIYNLAILLSWAAVMLLAILEILWLIRRKETRSFWPLFVYLVPFGLGYLPIRLSAEALFESPVKAYGCLTGPMSYHGLTLRENGRFELNLGGMGDNDYYPGTYTQRGDTVRLLFDTRPSFHGKPHATLYLIDRKGGYIDCLDCGKGITGTSFQLGHCN